MDKVGKIQAAFKLKEHPDISPDLPLNKKSEGLQQEKLVNSPKAGEEIEELEQLELAEPERCEQNQENQEDSETLKSGPGKNCKEVKCDPNKSWIQIPSKDMMKELFEIFCSEKQTNNMKSNDQNTPNERVKQYECFIDAQNDFFLVVPENTTPLPWVNQAKLSSRHTPTKNNLEGKRKKEYSKVPKYLKHKIKKTSESHSENASQQYSKDKSQSILKESFSKNSFTRDTLQGGISSDQIKNNTRSDSEKSDSDKDMKPEENSLPLEKAVNFKDSINKPQTVKSPSGCT
ncbi:unnamed protein product [Moneuplotes crassus]|uniref:Uncharacterized protein n=1 Tax=Euplotes crassus TaxID=5936 RepID=A0AAD1U454_EUPCR|nr:unnamed protein product [Moneuplotes crassus]